MTMPAQEGPPPPGAEGNMLTRKYGPFPGYVWLVAAGLAAYFLFFRGKGSSGAGGTSSGGGGQSTTGDISLQPGTTTLDLSGAPEAAITNPAPVDTGDINPGGPSQSGVPNPQPSPVPPPRHVGHHTSVNFTKYTVQKGENLLEIAKKFGISRATLAHANGLGTGAGLRAGQVLRIPHVRSTTG